MTNFEKYKDDLMEIEGSFAFNKYTEKIVKCGWNISCSDCAFDFNCLESSKIKWLRKEYEESILSDKELELIKVLGKVTGINYKYIAKDAYGGIELFVRKPCFGKLENYYSEYEYTYVDIASKDKSGDEVLSFPNITYEDGLYDIENKCFIKEEGDD